MMKIKKMKTVMEMKMKLYIVMKMMTTMKMIIIRWTYYCADKKLRRNKSS